MTVLFIHPPLQTKVSGGNIYNAHIIQQASENHYPLASLPVTNLQLNTALNARIIQMEPRLVIWDSLFFDFIANDPLTGSELTSALLIHYLPSQSPSLNPASGAKLKLLEDEAIRKCGRVICTGSTTLRTLAKRHPDKAVFLCCPGVDEIFQTQPEDSFKSRTNENLNLISVANLLPDKGYFELLEALCSLETRDWVWHIVGSDRVDCSFGDAFRLAATVRNLMPRIHFHGVLSQERLAILLKEMDLFVNASRYDSYGMATAEAVAAGLPVITTRTGAAAELVCDGHSGFLVPVGNPGVLHQALSGAMQNPEIRNRFRLNSRSRPRTSWQNCFKYFKQACGSIP